MKPKERLIQKSRSILIISALDFWSIERGKGGPALFETIQGYLNNKWKVCFITSNNLETNTLNPQIQNLTIQRFDCKLLKKMMRVRKIGFFFRIIWWVYFQINSLILARKIYSSSPIDIVYGYEIMGVPVSKVLSKIWGVPLVSRFQGTIIDRKRKHQKTYVLRHWEHFLSFKIPSNLIIMTNDGTQGMDLLGELGVDKAFIRFWMNGVYWNRFQSLPPLDEAKSALQLKSNFTLLSLSRLVGWKRVDRAIRAMPFLAKKYTNIILLVVGDGPERNELEELVANLDIKKHVRFEGAILHSDIPKYLAATDIFLSLYDISNVGNPLLEAMMAGKCVVTLNNGDTHTIISNRGNGVLLDYDSLNDLPEVLDTLINDEKIRCELGNSARKFAEANFWTWENRMNAEIKEISFILNNSSIQ